MANLIDEILSKVSGDMDIFKKIAAKIPGFSGYIERQNRRDSDKLLRENIAARFEELWDRVSGIQRQFIASGQIGYIDDLESSAIKLRTFADRIRRATRGYSGLFDAVKINEQELAQIYQYDAVMLELVDEVGRAIDNIEASIGTDGLPASLRHLETVTRHCIEIFDRREEVILSAPAS